MKIDAMLVEDRLGMPPRSTPRRRTCRCSSWRLLVIGVWRWRLISEAYEGLDALESRLLSQAEVKDVLEASVGGLLSDCGRAPAP